ncbi:protein binding [Striga hermonthica]|uniref:Protein binding n=1 Tax=Striga hermonthica TaxID=68872 RepID=A0A9N7NKB3_STRHE|nr:protein binding [Striga hermonthica]
MCLGSNTEWTQSQLLHSLPRKPKRTRVHIRRRLSRRRARRDEKVDAVMELKNLKLYMENITIMEENERLRRQASLLQQENRSLMSEFQRRFSNNYK